MTARDDTPGESLGLRCDARAPWLWRVAWRGDAPATESEEDELTRVARSRESGALVVLAPDGDAPRRLPDALLALTGSSVAPLEVALLPPAEACGPVRLFAPRGRGRVVLADAATGARLLERLARKEAFAQAQAAIDAAIGDFARRDGWQPLPARRHALDDGELLPAAAGARPFDHATGSDELFVETAGRGAAATPIAARMVREREAFTLRLAAGGRPLGRRQLVLVRATAPADRGALLRVELDDEDLGPWRLGDAQPRDSISFDLFRVSSDLLAGRDRIRVALRLEGRTEVAALRWWFLTEEEPDGLWLDELEPARAPPVTSMQPTAPATPATPERPAAAGRRLLVHDDELFLRGVALAPGEALRCLLPRGGRRLVSGVAARGAPKSGATLTVTANGAATRLDVPAGGGRCEVALDLRGEELVVACAGDAELLLLDPKLLR